MKMVEFSELRPVDIPNYKLLNRKEIEPSFRLESNTMVKSIQGSEINRELDEGKQISQISQRGFPQTRESIESSRGEICCLWPVEYEEQQWANSHAMKKLDFSLAGVHYLGVHSTYELGRSGFMQVEGFLVRVPLSRSRA